MKFCDRLKNLLHGRRDTADGSFAKAFRNSETLSADEYTETRAFEYGGRRCKVKMTKKKATRRTVIYCKDNGSVLWEQRYPSGRPSFTINGETVLCDLSFCEPDTLCVLLIRGKPNPIVGLDEGRFCSAHGTPRPDSLYVMSEAAFRTFSPPIEP